MIDRHHDLSIKRQTALLGIIRGTAYYRPRPVSDIDLQIMCRIDRIHTDHPTSGAGCCVISCAERASASGGGTSPR